MNDFPEAVAAVIRPLFGGDADGSYRLPAVFEPKGEELAEFETLAKLADRTGQDISEMMAMSWLDLLESAIVASVKTESMLMRAHLYRVGRQDLLEPWLAKDSESG